MMGGLQFDPVDDRIVINNPFTDMKTVEVTFSINPESNGLRFLVDKYPYGFSIFLNQGNLSFRHAQNRQINTGIYLLDRKTHVATMVVDGETIRAYLDKEIVGEINNAVEDTENRYTSIGNRPANGSFNGEIYSVRIYNRVLTESEIAHNYQIEKERWGQ